eukprot:1642566-Rhodomonas_salina.2
MVTVIVDTSSSSVAPTDENSRTCRSSDISASTCPSCSTCTTIVRFDLSPAPHLSLPDVGTKSSVTSRASSIPPPPPPQEKSPPDADHAPRCKNPSASTPANKSRPVAISDTSTDHPPHSAESKYSPGHAASTIRSALEEGSWIGPPSTIPSPALGAAAEQSRYSTRPLTVQSWCPNASDDGVHHSPPLRFSAGTDDHVAFSAVQLNAISTAAPPPPPPVSCRVPACTIEIPSEMK